MNYVTETPNAQFINQQFFNKLDQGMVKEAGAALGAFVRQRLREDGFTRKILPFQSITGAELDRQITEEPTIICEKEPDSEAATLNLLGKPEMRYWGQSRYPVTFSKIASKDFRKSKFELMTSRTDFRTILQENSVKDIQIAEDNGFVTNLNLAAAQNSSYSNIYSLSGGFTIANFMAGVNRLIERRLPVGCILMSQTLYNTLLAQPSTQIGSTAASSLFMGQQQLDSPFGFKIITTNKSIPASGGLGTPDQILPVNQMIVFAPPQFLGQAYSLQEPTVYLKAERDIIEFAVEEAVGIGIGNTQAFTIVNFN